MPTRKKKRLDGLEIGIAESCRAHLRFRRGNKLGLH